MGTGDHGGMLQVTQQGLEAYAQKILPHWTELEMETYDDGTVKINITRRTKC